MTPNEADELLMMSNAETAMEYIAYRDFTREQLYRFILTRFNRGPVDGK